MFPDSLEFEQFLAYLTDIFCKLNDVNIFLQSKNMNVILAYEKLNVFKDKISLWEDNIKHENVSRLPSLDEK
ncbi:hypothetical protein A3Q56_05923 [Intoshia linei]|uniref:Uncharacterized protein n=1 Tax=Intoshia linei TaxID=1819745 RepID=A0A177AYV7_9BILA|nr:hypothetical protein A3Q56_05923 [Intoshia linei]